MTFPPPAPQPSWAPPPPVWAVPPMRRIRPGRRRLGWLLIIGASLTLVVLGATAGRSVFRLLSSNESTVAPGSVTVDCDGGDVWRVGPVTGSTNDVGSITVTNQWSGVLDEVTVELDGVEVPVRAMGRGVQETFQYFGTIYTAVATFTCPSDGSAVVSFRGPEGVQAGVFPSIGQMIRPILILIVGGLGCVAAAVVGIVLAVLHRSSLERSGPPVAPVP